MISLEALLTEWATDSKMNRSELDAESLRTSQHHSKYLQILTAVKRRLAKQKQARLDLLAIKSLYYAGKLGKAQMDAQGWPYDPWSGGVKPLKSDVGLWLEADSDLSAMKADITETEILHDACMDIMNSLNWRHQSIGNAIRWIQFTTGN
jgi:hypothetical protein